MKKRTTLTLFLMLIFLSLSCTEEISSELKNEVSAANEQNIEQKRVGKKFKLVHKMAEEFSYNLHSVKGHDQPCELEADGTNFDPLSFDNTDLNNALDCVLEVQEMDLYLKGVDLEIQVDEYLCEAVSYVPFSYFKFPIGETHQTVYNVACSPSVFEANSDECSSLSGTYLTYDESSPTDPDNLSSFGAPFTYKTASGAKCYYDHSSYQLNGEQGPNCDPGKITTVNYIIYDFGNCTIAEGETEVACGENQGIWINDFKLKKTTTDVTNCGGSVFNCVGGHMKELFQDEEPEKIGIIYPNDDLQVFTKKWEIRGTDGTDNYHPKSIANFSRIFSYSGSKSENSYASTPLAPNNSKGLVGHSIDQFMTDFINGFYDQYFNVEENYQVDVNNDGNKDYTIYATSPFVSLSPYTRPYYSYTCLDNAFDIKAKIRLFIREWDRDFDKDNIVQNYLSDSTTFDSSEENSALMDNNTNQDGPFEPWNDFGDWDDWFLGSFTGDNYNDPIYNTSTIVCSEDESVIKIDDGNGIIDADANDGSDALTDCLDLGGVAVPQSNRYFPYHSR